LAAIALKTEEIFKVIISVMREGAVKKGRRKWIFNKGVAEIANL
jgi:hypothetical protein